MTVRRAISSRIVFTTSFGIEDQAITHTIFAQELDIDVITLDTGLLVPETLEVCGTPPNGTTAGKSAVDCTLTSPSSVHRHVASGCRVFLYPRRAGGTTSAAGGTFERSEEG